MFCKISLIFVSISNYLIWRLVGCRLPCEVSFPFESSITLVTLERIFPSVCPHVSLQRRWLSASIVALVTLVRFFFSMLPRVEFQFKRCNAWKIAYCATMLLFTRVRPFVSVKGAWLSCFVFTFIAMEGFFFSKCVLLCFFKLLDWVFPWCASWYAFWGQKNVCMRSCTVCACAVSPTCEWVRVSSTH